MDCWRYIVNCGIFVINFNITITKNTIEFNYLHKVIIHFELINNYSFYSYIVLASHVDTIDYFHTIISYFDYNYSGQDLHLDY